MAALDSEAIDRIGFRSVGRRARISDRASFHNPGAIRIGDEVRIDDFCVLSAGEGGIDIGRNVHIAIYSALIGKGRIMLSDFSNISSRVTIYSSNDDYSGAAMSNPTVPPEYTNVKHAPVVIGRHAIIGSGSIVLPGCRLADGVVVGALSLVKADCDEWSIYAGVPARRIRDRERGLLELEARFLDSQREA